MNYMQKNNFAVVLKENSEIIGTIGLNEDADGNENILNVGVRIVPQLMYYHGFARWTI